MERNSVDIATAVEQLQLTGDVRDAIAKLISLVDGDRAISKAAACGHRAIPALRAILWARELGGLFETRCRAVDALVLLGAYDVLIDYLAAPPCRTDPGERIAQDAVTNAAARAVVASDDVRVVPLLLRLAQQRPLAGVIEALGRLKREEALPYFVDALAEDFARPAAEAAIRALGSKTRPALLDAAVRRRPSAAAESPSSRRRRLSALKLLAELGPPDPVTWPPLRDLIREDDPAIAALACRLCLASGDEPSVHRAVERLVELLGSAEWPLSEDIEECLVERFEKARDFVTPRVEQGLPEGSYYDPGARISRSLARVVARAAAKKPER